MIDSTFSRATWLNSLHMSTLTLSLLEKEGFAREQLLEGSGITPADLLDLRRLISPWQEQQVFANACRLSDEPALGLRLGLRTRISAYGLLGYALLSAPTLGEALRIGLSYPVLLGTYFHLSLEVADGRAWLVATGYGEDEALRPFNTELCLGSLKVTCADLLGQPLPLLEAAFDYAGDEAMARAYAEGFACELHFERERSAIGFAAEWLERPLPLADPVTHREMLEQCRRQNIDLAARRAWLDKVRAILAERLQDPPGLEELARRLNCSTSCASPAPRSCCRAATCRSTGSPRNSASARPPACAMPSSAGAASRRAISAPERSLRRRGWRRRRSSATSPRVFVAPSPIPAMKARSKRKSAPHSPARKRPASWVLR